MRMMTVKKRKTAAFGRRTVLVLTTVLFLSGKVSSCQAGTEDFARIIGSESYSAEEEDYCYYAVLEQFLAGAGGYETMLGLDVSKPLSDQKCTITDQDMSWEEYFRGEADAMLTFISGASQEAKAAGKMDLSEAESYADRIVGVYQSAAQEAGAADLDSYLSGRYAPGVTEDVIRRLMTQSFLADTYARQVRDSFIFTDEELAACYEQNADEFRSYSYLYTFVSGNGYEDGEKDAAECVRRLLEADSGQVFRELTRELTGAEAIPIEEIRAGEIGNPDAEDAKWIMDPARQNGDLYSGSSGEDFYVLYWLSRDDHGFESTRLQETGPEEDEEDLTERPGRAEEEASEDQAEQKAAEDLAGQTKEEASEDQAEQKAAEEDQAGQTKEEAGEDQAEQKAAEDQAGQTEGEAGEDQAGQKVAEDRAGQTEREAGEDQAEQKAAEDQAEQTDQADEPEWKTLALEYLTEEAFDAWKTALLEKYGTKNAA